MDLSPEEAKKFWPLYESFERELAVPRSANTRATLDYVAAGHGPRVMAIQDIDAQPGFGDFQVGDGRAFGQEFGVGDHVEI